MRSSSRTPSWIIRVQPTDQGVVTLSGVTALYTAGTWDINATDTSSGITGAAFVNVQAAPAVALHAALATPHQLCLIAKTLLRG